MNIDQLLTTLGSGTFGAIAMYLVNFLIRDVLSKRIEKSIQHEFNEKLENLKLENDKKLEDTKHNYEIELTKLKAELDKVNSIEQLIFTNNHPKKIELAEVLVKTINEMYFDFLFFMDNDDGIEKYTKLSGFNNELLKRIGFIKLYFNNDLFGEISTFIGAYTRFVFEYHVKFNNPNVNNFRSSKAEFIDTYNKVLYNKIESIESFLVQIISKPLQENKEKSAN
jgi:hypothetical protein